MDHPCGRKVLGGHVTILEHDWGPWTTLNDGDGYDDIRNCKRPNCNRFEVRSKGSKSANQKISKVSSKGT